MKRFTSVFVAFLTASVIGQPAKADAPAPVAPQVASGDNDDHIIFSLNPPSVATYNNVYFSITSDREYTRQTKVEGNRLHVNIVATGPVGQISFEAKALDNTLSIDLAGQLNSKTQPNDTSDVISFEGNSGTPSVLLTDKSPVTVNLEFVITVDHAAAFNKSSNPKERQFGFTYHHTTTSLFKFNNTFEYDNNNSGPFTPKDNVRAGLKIKIKACRATTNAKASDGYQMIEDLDHPIIVDGKSYKYRLNIMDLVNEYLRRHEEIQLISNKLSSDLREPPLQWGFQRWLELSRGASRGDFALSSATEHIEIKVEQGTSGSVDYTFISLHENPKGRTDGYWPGENATNAQKYKFANSGVTIASGYDIGRHSAAEIRKLNIPFTLQNKLAPYAARGTTPPFKLLVGQSAYDFVLKNPIDIGNDIYALDKAVFSKYLSQIQGRYNAATTGVKFAELSSEAQTVIFDLLYNLGSLTVAGHETNPDRLQFPLLWSDLTKQQWQSAADRLKTKFTDQTSRRHDEGNLLQQAINNGTLN